MKFLDVKTDFAFKKVFGSVDSTDILISFLNAIIFFETDRKIQDLTIVDPYNIPMLKGMKDTYVDVKAELNDGSHVIIEMQILNHEGFEKRILYNAAKNYSIQLKKGEPYHLLNPVIALTITDFVLFENSPELISNFKLLEKKQFIEYSDDIELIFIELPKFVKTEDEITSIQDSWLYFIKNAGTFDCIPNNVEQELKKAFQIANEANLSEEELELQHKKKDWIYIQKSSIELATKTGLKNGMEQGLQQGLEQGLQKGLEQGLQDGLEQGLQKGLEQGLQDGLEQGLQKGLEQGLQKGLEQGLQDGLEQGLQKGLEQGEWQAKTKIVLSAYQMGLSAPMISNLTGFDENEILSILQKN